MSCRIYEQEGVCRPDPGLAGLDDNLNRITATQTACVSLSDNLLAQTMQIDFVRNQWQCILLNLLSKHHLYLL